MILDCTCHVILSKIKRIIARNRLIFSVIVIVDGANGERRLGIRDNILSGTSNVLVERIVRWGDAKGEARDVILRNARW